VGVPCRKRKRVDPSAFLLSKGTAHPQFREGGRRGGGIKKETAGPEGGKMARVAVRRVWRRGGRKEEP